MPTYSERLMLRNFEADLGIIDDLKLEKEHHARSMQEALQSHWL